MLHPTRVRAATSGRRQSCSKASTLMDLFLNWLVAGSILLRLAASTPAGVAFQADSSKGDAAVARLRAELARLINVPRWRHDRWSVMVVSLDHGDTLFAHQPGLPLAPASNLKLFTTASALYYLGPDFRFNTFLLADGPVTAGVLQGDLILYGTGDPTISDRFGLKESVWESFADTLASLGIREVRGDIIGDATYFTGSGVGEGWQDDYITASYAAPASALPYAENVATLRIRPGDAAGSPPAVSLVPGGAGIALVNDATTIRRGRSYIHVTRRSYAGPVVVQGQIALRSRGVSRTIPIADPAAYAAAAFREVLEERGIQVQGQSRGVTLPEDSPVTGRLVFAPTFDRRSPARVLAIHNSPPLLAILEVINKRSQNLMAEVTLRAVGRVALGQGTSAAGARAVRYMLDCETDGDSLALQQYDGSGLSPLNRVSSRSVIRLLNFMARSSMWENYRSTLPEVGAPDGLHRMLRTPAELHLWAKTGTLNHVSALSGMVHTVGGERLLFSMISNDVPSTWRAKRIEDAVGARLAAFQRSSAAVATSTAAPPPVAPPIRRGSQLGDSASARREAQPAPRRLYTIRRGDTLDGIARRFGTTVRALEAANPGIKPRRLLPGRKIRLPF